MKRIIRPITSETTIKNFTLTATDLENILSQINELQDYEVFVKAKENGLCITVGNVEYRITKNVGIF